VIYLALFLSAVSLFSTDKRFFSDVLTRLEAVMGVQIVSVLAKHLSQLANLSGVTALPHPKTQSEEDVEELICWLSSGV